MKWHMPEINGRRRRNARRRRLMRPELPNLRETPVWSGWGRKPIWLAAIVALMIVSLAQIVPGALAGGGPNRVLQQTITDSPDPVALGSPITYVWTVSNIDNGDTGGIDDARLHLDSALSLFGPTLPKDCSAEPHLNHTDVVCKIPGLKTADRDPDRSSIQRVIQVTANTSKVVTTNSVITPKDARDSVTNPSVDVSTSVGVDLGLTKGVAPTTVDIGNNVVYTLTVNNHGASASANTVVTDTMAVGVTADPAATEVPLPAGCLISQVGSDTVPEIITCNLGSIQPGQSVPVAITALVEPFATPAVNTASVTNDLGDFHPEDNTATASLTVLSSDVSVDVAGPAFADRGFPVCYDVTLTNSATADIDAIGVPIEIRVDNLSGVTVSDSPNCSDVASVDGGCTVLVGCTLNLGVGVTKTFRVRGTTLTTGADPRVEVRARNPELNMLNNKDRVDTNVP